MSTCESMKTAMHARLDGELPDAGDRALADHLLACAACRSHFEELRTIDALLGEIALTDRPAPRVVPIETAAPMPPVLSSRIPVTTWPALAASVLLAIVLLFTLPSSDDPAPPVANDPTTEPNEPFSVSFDEEELLAVNVPTENPQIKIVWLYTAHTDSPKGL